MTDQARYSGVVGPGGRVLLQADRRFTAVELQRMVEELEQWFVPTSYPLAVLRQAADQAAELEALCQRPQEFKCKARKTADPPQDCNWPLCDCDPYAEKVIAALQEADMLRQRPQEETLKLQRHLEDIWAELPFAKKAELMDRGLGLDPLILALRGSPPAPAERHATRNNWIPWRLVRSTKSSDSDSWVMLELECGHWETWPTESSTPAATKCRTCDPPTFRGKPFPWSLEAAPSPASTGEKKT